LYHEYGYFSAGFQSNTAQILAWSFLVEHEDPAAELKERGKPDKLKRSQAKRKRNPSEKHDAFLWVDSCHMYVVQIRPERGIDGSC